MFTKIDDNCIKNRPRERHIEIQTLTASDINELTPMPVQRFIWKS